ncbi:hypothetical protein H5410_062072, partial [Solanum commersonii]
STYKKPIFYQITHPLKISHHRNFPRLSWNGEQLVKVGYLIEFLVFGLVGSRFSEVALLNQLKMGSFGLSRRTLLDEFDLQSLKPDPGERITIDKYSPRIQDEVRRHYIQQGPYQPDINDNEYPQTRFETKMCRFCKTWFKVSYSRWLEYSMKKDVVFCLCCYLFKNDYVKGNGGDFFTKTGFKTWNHSLERFNLHVGESEKTRSEHRIRLEVSTNVARLLLEFGMSFRGHDESESSKNKGLF